ncbi:MAG: LAGLIDADG family homing endonuclease [archaeon]
MGSDERRIQLKSGEQRRLLISLSKKFGSLKKVAKKLDIPYSTLKNYNSESRLLPERLFDKILTLLPIQRESIDFTYLDATWGASLGGKLGMAALEKKYPKKINEWRRNAMRKAIETGKHYGYANMKKIKNPKLDENLAEIVGVYLGDGTLNKYKIRISGDYRYDLPYYEYLSKSFFKLFNITPKISREKNRNTALLTIYSKNLCGYLNKTFYLKYGDKIKNKSIIPKKILKNKKLAIACLRGLIDTDGSISRRGRNGSQFCIHFSSHNKILLEQVYDLGKRLKIFTYKDKYGAGTNKWENILRYFSLVGSSNLRHIVRFKERLNGNTIYQREVLNYYQKDLYKNINLPFYLGGCIS